MRDTDDLDERFELHKRDMWHCPFCSSNRVVFGKIQSYPADFDEDVELIQAVRCEACEQSWEDVYQLHRTIWEDS